MKWVAILLCGLPGAAAMPAACGESSTSSVGSAGHSGAMGGGEAGAGGAEPFCDCGDDPAFVHVPLDCACRAGLCSTLDFDPKQHKDYDNLGWPYVVLYGTCAGGYHTLEYSEACENAGTTTYDPQHKLVYSSYGPYGSAPAVCGPNAGDFGSFGIGEEDPARDCTYCVAAAQDDAAGGASGVSCIADDLATYEPCDPDWKGWSGSGGAGGAGGAAN